MSLLICVTLHLLLVAMALHETLAWMSAPTHKKNSQLRISNMDDVLPPRKNQQTSIYDLGAGKNPPLRASKRQTTVGNKDGETNVDDADDVSPSEEDGSYWVVPIPVQKPSIPHQETTMSPSNVDNGQALKQPKRTRRMVARDDDAQLLRKALWDEQHFDGSSETRELEMEATFPLDPTIINDNQEDETCGSFVKPPSVVYPNIDMSIPDTVYHEGSDGKAAVDIIWDNLKYEAYKEAQREPLLVSFLYSTILNHKSLESSLAFLLANRLQSPAMMISTQLQSIILDTLERDAQARRYLRADMMAVRDRDPACNTLPDVFLYFKGFHALQSHRVARNLWSRNKRVLASYLQSQVSQVFQIDIHPNATMKSGIMLDHGHGIVIGSTSSVGHNCSILHHVTLGGSGKKGVDRHPLVKDGVLLGAGATVLGPVTLGEGSQVGAGTLVISDIPPHSVAVGVPARIIGSFIDVTEQPSVGMNQMIDDANSHISHISFASENI